MLLGLAWMGSRGCEAVDVECIMSFVEGIHTVHSIWIHEWRRTEQNNPKLTNSSTTKLFHEVNESLSGTWNPFYFVHGCCSLNALQPKMLGTKAPNWEFAEAGHLMSSCPKARTCKHSIRPYMTAPGPICVSALTYLSKSQAGIRTTFNYTFLLPYASINTLYCIRGEGRGTLDYGPLHRK